MQKNQVDYNQKVLEVKNLRQYFKVGHGKNKLLVKAIDDISFDVYKREVFGLVGESGCGKTTTGRTIIRLYSPTDGTITFNGVRIGAGFSGNLHRIKKAKKEASIEILKATPYKYEKYLLDQALQQAKADRRLQVQALKAEYQVLINEVKQPVTDYKNALSDEERHYRLVLSDLKYQKTLQVKKAKGNNFEDLEVVRRSELNTIKEEIRKTAAALKSKKEDKSRIDEELAKLEVEKNERISQINLKFDDLITQEHTRIGSKHDVAERIKKIQMNIDESIQTTSESYRTKIEALRKQAPDGKPIKLHATELKAELKEKTAKLLDFSDLKKDYQDSLDVLNQKVAADPSLKQTDKEKVEKLKKDLSEIIKKERQGIKQAKKDNTIHEPKELAEKRKAALKEAKAASLEKINALKAQLTEKEKGSDAYVKLNEKIKVAQADIKTEIAGIKATLVNQNDIMARMQMIFQDPIASLNPRMVVREIIAEGLRIKGIHDRKLIDEKVYQSLKLVGLLPEHASRYPHEFSGGQRQRIGIARTLVVNPEFIIADEPISALDVSIQAQVINLLNDLKNELGLTILFIAHDLSVVKYFSDRIAVMYFGKIVELASADELFKNPLHPYTKALLSAIPHPDPISEKKRVRQIYNPAVHDYSQNKPELKEIRKGHFIYANDKEYKTYKKELGL